MTTVEDIKQAVSKLAPEQLARLRAWFEEFDARLFAEKIERDAKSGKLDRLPKRRFPLTAKVLPASYEVFRRPCGLRRSDRIAGLIPHRKTRLHCSHLVR